MNINEKLKNRRKELGLTMLDVANRVGVSEGTVSRWESGDIANMRRDKIVLLANALQVQPSFIMGWEDEESKLVFSTTKEPPIVLSVTPHEEKVVISYREQPQMQGAVDKLLGIGDDSEGKVRVMGERDNVTRIAAFGGGTDSDDDTVKHT